MTFCFGQQLLPPFGDVMQMEPSGQHWSPQVFVPLGQRHLPSTQTWPGGQHTGLVEVPQIWPFGQQSGPRGVERHCEPSGQQMARLPLLQMLGFLQQTPSLVW